MKLLTVLIFWSICALATAQSLPVHVNTRFLFLWHRNLQGVHVSATIPSEDKRVDAKKNTDSLGRTVMEAKWLVANKTVEIRVENFAKACRFCKKRTKNYYLKKGCKDYLIESAITKPVDIRLRRRWDSYDYMDAGVVTLGAVALGSFLYSESQHNTYRQDYLNDNRETYYQRGNNWHKTAVITSGVATLAFLTRLGMCISFDKKRLSPSSAPLSFAPAQKGIGILCLF